MCSHFLGHHKETEKENKHPYIKKIMDEAALIVDKFNEMFAKLEDFYMEYVTKFVYNKKLTAIFYAVIVILTLFSFKIYSG